MDRLCALALTAVEAALQDAGWTPATWAPWAAERGERVGVVFGTAYGCHATNEEFYRGLLAEGPRGASPRLFAYTLPSSPLGEISIHIGARGPAQTLASGGHAGLEAVGHAGALCRAGRADVVLAVAAEVGGGTLGALGLHAYEGAVALVLERGESARERGARARAGVVDARSSFCAGAPGQATASVGATLLAPLGGAGAAPERHDAGVSDGAVAGLRDLVAWCTRPLPLSPGRALFTAADPAGGACALALVTAPAADPAARRG
ncbi:MAG TPA: beta-ketoacyl synthase N-terminal-like domain-containing protein [Polyangia bacterium]|jgi:3-oxoacyl-[acyl-carrier-protein] synthase II|nr:beta-ketoacyl synthase N-terminal-like domain-containing protein [Polyangia bacterium]